MTFTQILQLGSFLLAAVAFIVSAATFVRNGNWRNSDEGRKLSERIDTIERAKDWQETDAGRRLVQRVTDVERSLSVGEERFKTLATKSDVTKLEGEINGLEKAFNAKIDGVNSAVGSVGEGVDRIEGYFLNKGMQ